MEPPQNMFCFVSSHRGFASMLCGLLLIYDLQAVLVYCFLFLTTEGKSLAKNDQGEPFELNEYLLGTFSTRSFNGSWLTG